MKRLLDLALAAAILALTLPVMAVAALLILIYDGRPVVFRQQRTGIRGSTFIIFKFRTMKPSDAPGTAATVTRTGKWLRRLSIDELPSLVNVLRGEMSLVGPRPLLPEYLPYYHSGEHLRHQVLPGVTGWAQVNGRNAISWEEKFRLDTWYVANRTILLDLQILLQTLFRVVSARGINHSSDTSMPKLSEIRKLW